MVFSPKRRRKIIASLTTRKASDPTIGFLSEHFEQISSEFVIRESRIETVDSVRDVDQ